MKKHTYRTKNVNKINWTSLKERLNGEAAVFAIDIAKEKQYAMLSTEDNRVSTLISWNHPEQTGELLTALGSLKSQLTMVMESTGTYGDALRYQFKQVGFETHQISAKRVSDAGEVFDGVPSIHDAKSATLISQLYWAGISRPWRESTDEERCLDALRREYDLHQSQHQRNRGRLESQLSRHWPEVLYLLDLDSVTLESLLIEYGSPACIARHADAAAEHMRCWGKSQLKAEKIERVIESAIQTWGQPCIAAEQRYLQALAEELRHSRMQQKQARQALENIIKADEELKEMRQTIGLVTTAIFLSCRLDPRLYSNARSYEKAMGMNLKEKSSGRHVGQLKLTKRGSSMARRYLYFAVLRLINNDPVVKAWYQKKVDPRAKNKTVIALMRKLSRALWYVARGERFDTRKLLTVADV